MKIIDSVAQWRKERDILAANASLGFVPTMGNLHPGHVSLIERSVAENPKTVVSIFINPTQFNNKEDFENYPQTLAEDIACAKAAKADFIFLPSYTDLYSDNFTYQVNETCLSNDLEGEFRPGHFTGMLTVVLKLLLLIKARRAYFGEKDWQQLQLITGMAKAFFLDTEIIACKTIRDAKGLALSSRNSRLTRAEYLLAQEFAKTLCQASSCEEVKKKLIQQGIAIDYVEEREGRRFAAVKIGQVRLIDNIDLTS